jgi:transcriptional regulator with GAF, ATPase, and Fis domain
MEKLTSLAEVEKNYILNVLEEKEWRISGIHGAATILGMKESTLRSKMKKLGISKPAAVV